MQIKVDEYIKELLYENDAVNIPGLGGLITEYQPAQIDHVQAKMLPPARDVTLNTNLPIDDGLLTQRVADAHHLSGLEAEQIIRDYVESLQDALNAGEIIAIQGVGRLYKNHSGDLHLMSDHHNFDTSVYGLPAVASPVIQRQDTQTSTKTAPVVTASVSTPKETDSWATISNWFQENLWIVVSAAMIVFVLTVWLLFFNDTQDPTSGLSEVKELPEDRVNVSPGLVEDDELVMEEPTPSDDPGNTIPEQEPASSGNSDSEEALDTESPTVDPSQNVALIRIGIFGDRKNVTKLVQKIYDEGFEPYTREKGSLIEVGVQFAYDDQQEVRANLRAIQKKFEEKAKVVE